MPVPTTKKELEEAIRADFALLQKELATIPESMVHTMTMEGHAKGTRMSIHNLLAYLNGWGLLVLKWNKSKDNGETADLPETGYKWNELGPLAQKFYSDFEHLPYPSLLNALEKTFDGVLKLLESKSNAQLYKSTWYKTYTLGRMIQLNTTSPYKNARLRVRKWKKEKKIK